MGSVPPFSTLASASLDRESRRIQHQVNPSTVSLQQLPQVPTHTDQQLSRRDNFSNFEGAIVRERSEEGLPTVDYDRPLVCSAVSTGIDRRPHRKQLRQLVYEETNTNPTSPTARAMSPEAQLEEICDQMQALDIQASAFRQINIDLWDNDITHDEKDKIAVTTYVAKFIFIVQSGSDQGYDLLGYFQQHFEEWTEDTWDRGNCNTISHITNYREPQTWPEQEFTEMVFDERTAAFRRQTALLGSNASTNPHPSQPPSPSVTPLAAPHQGLNEPQPIKTLTSPPNAPTPAPTIQDKPAPTSLTIHPTSYRFQNPDLVQPVTNPIPEHLSGPATFGEYMKLPPDNIPNAIVDSDIQQKFMKTWNKDRNYTGEPETVTISRTLSPDPDGRAQRFYLDKITWATTFRQAYDIFKQHFDTEVNHVHYHTDWTTITFNSILLQTSLISFSSANEPWQEYGGDLLLRTTLMKACRGVPELQYALSNPPITSSTFLQIFYYLDRRYNNNRSRGRYGYSGQRPSRGYGQSYNQGCWSTKHSTDERQKAKDQHITQCHFIGVQLTDIGGYILDYEGHEMSSFDDTEDTWEEHDNSTNDHPEQWQASQMLCQQAFNHLITGEDVYQTDQTVVPASQFIIEDRYSRDRFQGIMIDTAGYSQYIALQREDPSVDPFCSALLIWTGLIPSIVVIIVLIALPASQSSANGDIPGSSLRKMKSLSFLTETEIRTLHRRFGHPAVPRLHHLLKQAGHTPRRFKFTLNDDQEFNYEIIVDVMHLGTPQRPVLHVVDSATAFQGARFLPSMSAKDTWETLRTLWIDTKDYNQMPQVPVETHWSIGKIERYHAPSDAPLTSSMLRLATPPAETVLQMAVKAINDTAGPDGLVPMLLVFGAYLAYLQTLALPLPLKRSEAMQKAMKMLRQLSAERRVKDASMHATARARQKCYPSRCKVKFAFGEKDGWQGPFKIASIDSHNITIDTVNGPKSFDRPLYNRIRSDLNEQPAQDPVKTLTDLPARPEPRPCKRGRPPGSKNKPKDLIMMACQSDNKEITDLVGRGVFQFERYDQMIKGINTKPYEKSRLPETHPRYCPGLLQNYGITLSLRDITQAYPQSQTKLSDHSYVFAHGTTRQIPNGTIIRVIKPLYGIAEAGVHWFRTYQQHHLEKLDMSTSTYDSCLLISNTGPDTLGIVECKLMTPSSLERTTFLPVKKKSYKRQNFVPSPRLTSHTEQRSKMTTIDPKAIDRHQRYVEERARASYIASIAQPEASFDVSVAAQRLQWQMDHQLRGLTYKPIDLATAKLMVFTDGSFANNKDLSSQLGFRSDSTGISLR
ncbi:HHT1, Histones H3 and H4 [Hirsutella rhossiliensis]